MTRPLQEQLENLRSAHVAMVEVAGLLPEGTRVHVRVDAERPELEVQLIGATHEQAVTVATELGLMRDAEGNPRDVRRSRFAGADIVHTWRGAVADFPLLLVRVEPGAARVRMHPAEAPDPSPAPKRPGGEKR